MKLHLPKLLRNAVLSCLAAVAGIATTTTVGTATFTGGVVAFALSTQQTAAATLTTIATMDQLVSAGTIGETVVDTSGTNYASYRFDGQSAITGISNAAVLNAITSTSTTNYLTVAAWIKVEETSGVQSIFGYGAQSDGYKFTTSGDTLASTAKGVADNQASGSVLTAGEWTLVAFSFCLDGTNNDRYYVGVNNGNYYTKNFSNMTAPGEEDQLFAIGSGNGNNLREAFTGEIQNLTIFTSDGQVNNSDIAAIMGTVAPSMSSISWTEWNTASTDNTWAGSNWTVDDSTSTWTDGSNASFSGSGETVTIGTAVSANYVRVLGENWAFSGNGTLTVAEELTVGDGLSAASLDISDFDGLTASLIVKNAGTLIIGSALPDNLNVQGGGELRVKEGTELAYGSRVPGASSSKLTIAGTGTKVTTTHTGANGFFAGEISVTDGATLELKEYDSLGYNGGATSKITVQNATLAIGARTTFNTDLDMKSGAVISATEYGGSNTDTGNQSPIIQVHADGNNVLDWTVSGTGNKVESGVLIRMNRDLNINVADAGELLIEGTTDYSSKLTKSGAGVLALSGDQFSASEIEVAGGTLRLDGNYDRTKLTRLTNGSLTVGASSTTSLLELAGYGTVTVTSGGSLTLNIVDVAEGQTLVITGGATTGNNFDVVGAGTLQIDALNVTSSLTMNGVKLTADVFNLQTGTELIYGKGDVLNIGALQSAVTLSLYGAADKLAEGVALGFTKGDKSLEEIKALLTVTGLSDYTLEERDGSLFLSSTSTMETDWDINWGSTLHSAPAVVLQHSLVESEYTEVVDNTYNVVELAESQFDSGSVIAVELTGHAKDNTVVVGTLRAKAEGQSISDTIEREIWIKATNGSYQLITGGTWNAWGDSSTAGRYMLGDTHIMVEGTDVQVGNIIGGHFQDQDGPTLTGDTFISIISDSVGGSIVGSGANCHLSTVTHTGDTNIFIYSALSTTEGLRIPTANCMTSAVVLGGSAHIANTGGGTAILNGDTHITIDIDTDDASSAFTKKVVGGHFNEGNVHTQTLNGSTYITIDASNVSFTDDVIGGSHTKGDSPSSITGSTNLVIEDGTFTAEGKAVYGGSFHLGGAGSLSVGSSNVSVNGGTIATLYGGHAIGGTGTTAISATLGDTSISVTSGSVGTLIGGSVSARNNADSTVSQGNIVVDLQGGTVGDVYAAGEQNGSTTLTTASTTVKLASAVSITGSTISGGYKVSDGQSGSTVTGASTLEFNGAQNRSAINFKDFSAITNADAVTVGALSSSAAVTKSGAGVLTLAGTTNALTGGLTVSAGGIATTGATTLGGALTLGNGTSLDMTAGIITLTGDNTGALTLGNNIALNVVAIDKGSSATIISGFSNTDLISGEVAASTYFASINGSDQLGNYLLKVEGNSLVLVNAEDPAKEVTWDVANDTWKVGSKFGSTDADTFASGDAAVFAALTTTTEEVTIDGAVAAGSVSITAGEGNTYSFTSANNGQLTTPILEIGAGTAVFGAGTLNVDALETVTVDGTLDIVALSTNKDTTALMKKLASATGSGTVKIGSGWAIINDLDTIQFNVDIEADDAIEILRENGSMEWNVANTITVTDGTGAKGGDVLVGRHVNLNVQDGGVIEAEGAIKLGNSDKGSGSVGSELTLAEGGSIKVSSIALGTDSWGSSFASSFTMEGGTLELTGTDGIAEGITTVISGGELVADSASWGITGASIGGATVKTTGDNTITLTDSTLTGTINNADGQLVLSGSVDITSDGYEVTTTPTRYSNGSNGYAVSDTSFTLVDTVANLTTEGVTTWTVDGESTGVDYAEGVVTLAGSDWGTEYFIVSSAETLSYISKTNSEGEALTTIVLAGEGLNMNEALGEGVTIRVDKAGESVVDVASGVTLSAASVSSDAQHQLKLHGAGTYALADGVSTLGAGVVLGDWTGTVKVTGAACGNMTDALNALGNANSTVEVSGVSGWFNTGGKNGQEGTNPCTVNLKLTNGADGTAAITINNMNSDNPANGLRYANITGSISGSGDIKFVSHTNNANTANYANYRFSGDVSGWEGSFINAGAYNRTVQVLFTGDATTINADVRNDGNVAGCVSYLVMDADSDMTMNGEVNVNKLIVNRSTSFTNEVTAVEMENAATATTTLAAGKTLTAATLTNSGTLTANGVLTVTGTANNSGTLNLANDTIFSTLTNSGTLTATDKTLTVTSAANGEGSISAGALTLQGTINTVGALTLSGDLTLGTEAAASTLTAGELSIGGKVVIKTLAENLITSTGLASGTLLNLSIDEGILVSTLSNAGVSSLTLGEIEGLTLDAVTLNGDSTSTTVDQYQYTLELDDANNLVIKAATLGIAWGGNTSDEDNNWSTADNWEAGIAPTADDKVKFDGRGSADVIIGASQELTYLTIDVADATEDVTPVSAYTFKAAEGTDWNYLDIADSLSVVKGELTVGERVNVYSQERTEVQSNGTLNISQNAFVRALQGIDIAGTVTIDAFTGGEETTTGNAGKLYVVNDGNINITETGNVTVDGVLAAVAEGTDKDQTDTYNPAELQYNSNGSDLTNKGTIDSSGSIYVSGDMQNSGSITQTGGEMWVLGAVTNSGTLSVESGTVSIGSDDAVAGNSVSLTNSGTLTIGGEADAEGNIASMTVQGDLDNTDTGTIGLENGQLTVEGKLTNDGTITVTGGSLTTAEVDNTGSLAISGGSVTVGAEGAAAETTTLSNTGTITVGTDADNTASLTVNGSLSHSGTGDIEVKAGSTMDVTGNLSADGMTLDFDGIVTVGGDVKVNDLTINEGASFTANGTGTEVDITTLTNNGSLSVGTMEGDTLKGGNLHIGTLNGTGDVIVGEGGTLSITNSVTFEGSIDNQGSMITDNTMTLTDYIAEGKGGSIEAQKLVVMEGANGSVFTSITTDSITIETLTAAPTLITDEVAARTADGKITINLAQLTPDENGSWDSATIIDGGADAYHLLQINSDVAVSDLFTLNLDSDVEQEILAAGLKAELWDGKTTDDSVSWLADGAGAQESNVLLNVREQTDAESVWTVGDTESKAGLVVLEGGSLKSDTILDNVRKVEVDASDASIDLSGDELTRVVLNNLTDTTEGRNAGLTLYGDANDTFSITTNGDSYATGTLIVEGGTVSLDGGVDEHGYAQFGKVELLVVAPDATASIELEDSRVSMNEQGTATFHGNMQGGTLELVKGSAVGEDSTLNLDGTDVKLIRDNVVTVDMVETGTIETMGQMTGTVGKVEVHPGFTDAPAGEFYKYFDMDSARLENSAIVADRNTSYYRDNYTAESANGAAGMEIADEILTEYYPQLNRAEQSELANALDAIENAGSSTERDELAASLAGAGTAVLGMAVSGDVDRQLRAIRNRTTTMGVDQSVANEDMPYFNAWINAEGAMNELSDSGTEGGYKLNSWGGTVGFDVDICPTFTAGLAFTAMYGDLDVTGADEASGDLDTYYLSAFARYSESAWTHTFVATVGTGDISLDRTVLGHKLESETDSLSFGLMYEVGRVFALDEDGTACLQPVFNVTWKHTTVDGYTEEGSDLALKVDEQTVDTVTFGLGARLQAVVGESMYNRTSIFEARVLAKADVGDRNGSADVGLASLGNTNHEVESAEMGAFGLEAGAGLTIPVGEEGGSIFMDASVELRSDYTDVNGTVGYRINF